MENFGWCSYLLYSGFFGSMAAKIDIVTYEQWWSTRSTRRRLSKNMKECMLYISQKYWPEHWEPNSNWCAQDSTDWKDDYDDWKMADVERALSDVQEEEDAVVGWIFFSYRVIWLFVYTSIILWHGFVRIGCTRRTFRPGAHAHPITTAMRIVNAIYEARSNKKKWTYAHHQQEQRHCRHAFATKATHLGVFCFRLWCFVLGLWYFIVQESSEMGENMERNMSRRNPDQPLSSLLSLVPKCIRKYIGDGSLDMLLVFFLSIPFNILKLCWNQISCCSSPSPLSPRPIGQRSEAKMDHYVDGKRQNTPQGSDIIHFYSYDCLSILTHGKQLWQSSKICVRVCIRITSEISHKPHTYKNW